MNKDYLLINSTCLPNQSVHLTPEARAFFAFAISEQNFSFANSSLASGVGDFYVRQETGRIWRVFGNLGGRYSLKTI